MKSSSNKNNNIELKISIIMRVGVCLSVMIMIFGIVLLLFCPKEYSYPEVISIKYLYESLIILDPYSIILLGIFILIITPIVRVIASIALFLLEKNFLYAIITVAVLLILIISFVIALFIR